MGKIHDLGRLVDEDEPERDQAIGTALRQPRDPEVYDVIQRQHALYPPVFFFFPAPPSITESRA